VSSLQDALEALERYKKAIEANAKPAQVADTLLALIRERNLGHGSVDIAWTPGDGATVLVWCKLTDEAEIRRLVYLAAAAAELELATVERTDRLKFEGYVGLNYGPIKLALWPDGQFCRRVQVGSVLVPEHEEPVYEIVCEQPEKGALVEEEVAF